MVSRVIQWLMFLLVLVLIYLVFTDTPLRRMVESAAGAAPTGMRGAAQLGLSLLVVLAAMFACVLLPLLGMWGWAKATAARDPVATYRKATRRALEKARMLMEAELARHEKERGLSPQQMAELRKDFDRTLAGVAESANRHEQIYAENPAVLEHDVQAALESVRAKQRKKL